MLCYIFQIKCLDDNWYCIINKFLNYVHFVKLVCCVTFENFFLLFAVLTNSLDLNFGLFYFFGPIKFGNSLLHPFPDVLGSLLI